MGSRFCGLKYFRNKFGRDVTRQKNFVTNQILAFDKNSER